MNENHISPKKRLVFSMNMLTFHEFGVFISSVQKALHFCVNILINISLRGFDVITDLPLLWFSLLLN